MRSAGPAMAPLTRVSMVRMTRCDARLFSMSDHGLGGKARDLESTDGIMVLSRRQGNAYER